MISSSNQPRLQDLESGAAQYLRQPWNLAPREKLQGAALMVLQRNQRPGITAPLLQLTARSRFGMEIRNLLAESANDHISADDYLDFMGSLLEILEAGDLVVRKNLSKDEPAWALQEDHFQWCAGDGRIDRNQKQQVENTYFSNLYQRLADGGFAEDDWFELQAAEHTAQVDSATRQERENAFKNAELRLMFCSPTMELGVGHPHPQQRLPAQRAAHPGQLRPTQWPGRSRRSARP